MNFSGGSSGSIAPPDSDGSVGPNHYVQFINGRFAVYNKATGANILAETDAAFWNAAGISTAVTNAGLSDTRVFYDSQSDRWFAAEINVSNTGNQLLVGRSDSNNPASTWKAVNFTADSGFGDFPTMGVDANAVMIGTNNFTSGTGGFYSVTLNTIPKADLLLSTPSVANRSTFKQTSAAMGMSLQGVTNPAANSHSTVVAVNNTAYSKINVTQITGTSGAGAVLGATTVRNTASTSDPGYSRQPDGTQQIDGDDYRIPGMVYQVGDLIFLVHGLSVNSSGAAATASSSTTNACRVTVIRDSTKALVTEATYYSPSFDYSYPSIAVNSYGDIIMGFTRSSAAAGSGATNGNLGAYAVYGNISLSNPTAGITFSGGDIQLKAGLVNNYHLFGGVGERWGDFSATGVDPSNPTSFWTTQEFSNTSNSWGTQISQVYVSPQETGVSSTLANGTYGTGTIVPITVAFNDAVVVTGSPILALNSGGTATYASGSGTNTLTFNYTVGAGQTSAKLDYTSTSALTLPGGATIKDQASNLDAIVTLATPGAAGSLGANKNIVIVATASTTVTNVTSTLANGTYGAGAVVPVTIAFNNAVVVTGTPTLALNSGGTATYSSGSGTSTLTFNYTVAAGQTSANLDYTSTSALTLPGAASIKDQATNSDANLTLATPGTAGSLGANKSIVIDAVAPTVTNVTSTTANGTYGSGAAITITVAFSKSVNVTGTPTLALNSGGTASYVSGSGSNTLTFSYTVGAGQSAVNLDSASASALSGTIKDTVANNPNPAVLTVPVAPAAGSLGASKSIVIDAVAPTVTNVTSTTANGTYGSGAAITITVAFSKSVNVTGTPTLALNSGGTASYVSGSGSNTLTFSYTVGAGQSAANLDSASVNALSGTVKDTVANSPNPAVLTVPVAPAAGSLGASKNIVIDAVAPTVTNVTSTTANGTYGSGAAITITVAFSKSVNVTGTPTLALNSGGTASYVSGSGSNTLTFSYTVGAGQSAANLDSASASALSGTIKDTVANSPNPAVLTVPVAPTAGSLGANKSIVIVALPAWLDPTSVATWDGSTHILTVTGAAKIIADPGSDNPTIIDGNAGIIEINTGITVTNVTGISGTGGLMVDTGASLTIKSIAQTSLTVNGFLAIPDKAHGGNQIELGSVDASGNTTTAGVLTIARDSSNNFTGRIDLSDRMLLVHYFQNSATPARSDGPANYIDAALAQGRNVAPGGVFDGPWNGSGGIVSSTAAQNFITAHNATGSPNTEFYALGFGDTGKMTLPNGTIADKMLIDDAGPSFFNPAANSGRGSGIGSTVFVRYTRVGDATMDGVVANNDVTVVGLNFDPSYNPTGPNGPMYWYDGNFNYSGVVANNDVTMLGLQYDPSQPPVPLVVQNVTPSVATSASPMTTSITQQNPVNIKANQVITPTFSVVPIVNSLDLAVGARSLDNIPDAAPPGLFYDPSSKLLA